jgi:hypothetical protein
MKITSSAGLLEKSFGETFLPSTALVSEKSGAFVPNGNIVLAVFTMTSPFRIQVSLRAKEDLSEAREDAQSLPYLAR